MTRPPDFSAMSDANLIASARAGNAAAQRELFERFHPRLLDFLTRMVRDPDLADDLAQQTLVKVFNALEDNPPQSNVWAWMRTIANNLGMDHFRARHSKSRHLETVPLDDGPDVTPVGPAGTRRALRLAAPSDPTPVRSVPREFRERLEWAIQQLPDRYRSCLIMRHLEDRSYGDIAELLGIPTSTVGTRLHRGNKLLQKLLPPESDPRTDLTTPTPA